MEHCTPSDPLAKFCGRCKTNKPATLEYFTREKATNDGLSFWCRDCKKAYYRENKERVAEYHKAWYKDNKQKKDDYDRSWAAANKDKRAQSSKRYRAKNKDKVSERERVYKQKRKDRDRELRLIYYAANQDTLKRKRRNYYYANQEKSRKYGRDYYHANRDHAREQARSYAAANKEISATRVRRRRAIKKAARGNHTAQDVQRQYDAQSGRCIYCLDSVGDTYHVDHVIPLVRGGSNGPENIVIACPTCNGSKGTKLPFEWLW